MQTPFIGQLEPAALLQHLRTHPPAGFALASTVGGTPTFATRFDLLTTADAPLRERIRGLPLYRVWGRLLRPRTRFIGATASEYAWLPGSLEPAALAARLVKAHGREYPFLIVKDVLQDSPLLDARDNAYADAFLQACRAAGFVLMAGQALAWVPIDFADEDAYLARLSRGARRDIRRKLRVRDQIAVETLATGSAALCDPATLDACVALYEQVYAQSEIHFDRLDGGFLRAVLSDPDCGGVVFVYRHEGRMIGWNLCFEHNGMLVDKYVGFDYPAARDFNLYAVSWMHNLGYARERGLTHYIAGWTDPEIKAHLGARFTFTRHAVRPRNRLLRALLRRIAPYFESDRNWHEQRTPDASRRS
ncbi:GNAT family N-acetyltransferase [Salinisphaera hydrothermalis]|uniref:GNAT family N-acetyltransferase n=1 Tax=Salinisphaera hydrothermalis TaxID=563188 RepID=UPI00333F9604